MMININGKIQDRANKHTPALNIKFHNGLIALMSLVFFFPGAESSVLSIDLLKSFIAGTPLADF
ncbi:hypothetical protein D3C73_1121230 [compost metagenome]